jgi:hypothetical protein
MPCPFFPHPLGYAKVGHTAWVLGVVNKAALMRQHQRQAFFKIFFHFLSIPLIYLSI